MLGGWLLVIGGITTLLIAANRREKEHVCSDILVGIKGNEGKFYVEKEDVLKLMEKTLGGGLLHRNIADINLARLESGLKTNPWIKQAELYFDSKDALHVFVDEREPIARVFTTRGTSFYMDSSGARMPLLEKMSIRVPVITGFTAARKMNAADSALLQEVKQVVRFIYGNEFWNAQVGQIDITAESRFELIPVVGDHVIKLGDGQHVEQKLNRLYVFYKQVMSKVGFSKYAALDVAFDGQVVAIKKEPTSPVDSIQLQKNIEELMNRASLQNIDKDMLPDQNFRPIKVDSTVSITPAQVNAVSTKTNPGPAAEENQTTSDRTGGNTATKKTESKSSSKKSTVSNERPEQREKRNEEKANEKPKAVMPKKAGPR